MAVKKEVSSNIRERWGYRHQQCFILFWTYATAYSMKSCMGMTLVAMTQSRINEVNMTEFQGEETTLEFRPKGILNALILIPPYPTFNWNKKVQDTIIASFYWGYMLLQLPAGMIAHRLGVRCLLTGAMTINFVISIILPTATYYGSWYCTAVCRLVQGLSQACIVPGLHTALGKWTPLHERGRLAGFVYGGQAFGIVLGLPLMGIISASPMGWPGIFRFYGMVSGTTAALIWFLLSDSPAKHPKISFKERKYIEDDVGVSDEKEKIPVPWLKILSHKGVYAIIFSHIAHTWGHLTLHSEVPTYMDKIMGVNIKANGLLTALPFLGMWCANFFFNWFTDWLVIKEKLSVTNARKFVNSLGFISASIGLIALAFAPHNIFIVETLLVLICSLKVSACCGFMINHIDISPNYAGIIMSISNFMANIGSSISPIVVGVILTDVEDKYLWRQVFLLTAGVYLVMNLFYVILGTSERAKWNNTEEEEDIEDSRSMINKVE